MAEKLPENMVLRTVYLEPDIDQELRRLAYANNTTKNDLIRRFVSHGLGQDIDPLLSDVQPVIATNRRNKVLRVTARGQSLRKGVKAKTKAAKVAKAAKAKKAKPKPKRIR